MGCDKDDMIVRQLRKHRLDDHSRTAWDMTSSSEMAVKAWILQLLTF